ncbi:mobilization protein [Yinghuangia sp. ASG 101]|uniref:relaxase/mobilization nuclease domain-containing protein n=1 Tax=Yinghuangia sp. ASG 101 TaxID=2896848 RepID=UPI001E41DC61|nr:mobilization protein [Yinghuangia sp. ASG 101]UGQ15010.1 mobilization protein [Yinghuangia sp. ASG 101]
MWPQVHKQESRTIGLLSYLYGPKDGEHTDPHLVASYDGFAPDPGRDTHATLKELAALLDLPVRRAADKAPTKHVWHISVRAAPEDRTLTDEEWGDIARRIVKATGIDAGPDSDLPGCRWVAVRHAEDHIHIAATLVRSNGEAYHPFKEGIDAQEEARLIERDYRLRRLDRRDRTAARRPSKAEQHKAKRTGRLPRKQLQTLVRTAAAYAADPDEFLALLHRHDILVQPTRDARGVIHGYKVALPDDLNANSEPVWFAGSTLAPDLTWPKIHARLTATAGDGTTDSSAAPQWPDLAAPNPWDRAAAHLDRITALLQTGANSRTETDRPADDTQIPDEVAAALRATVGELLHILPEALHGHPLPTETRYELRQAADAFAHAARTSGKAAHAYTRAMRSTVRALADTVLSPNTSAEYVIADLIAAALLTVIAISRWHQARKHEAQARAAATAAHHLRAAYRATAPRSLHRLAANAPHTLLVDEYAKLTGFVLTRRAGPVLAEEVLADDAIGALTTALHHGIERGHHPLVLLDHAVTRRELLSADNPAEVLTWRIHRLARTHPAAARRESNTKSGGRRTGARTASAPRTGNGLPTAAPTTPPANRRTR